MFNVGDKFINTSNLIKMEIVSIDEENKSCEVKSYKDNSIKTVSIKNILDAICELAIEKID